MDRVPPPILPLSKFEIFINSRRMSSTVAPRRLRDDELLYQASLCRETAIEEVLAGMKVALARWFGSQVMECDEVGDEDRSGTRRRRRALRNASAPSRGVLSRENGHRTLGAGLEIVGIDVEEAVWKRRRRCTYFAGETVLTRTLASSKGPASRPGT